MHAQNFLKFKSFRDSAEPYTLLLSDTEYKWSDWRYTVPRQRQAKKLTYGLKSLIFVCITELEACEVACKSELF